MRTAWAVAALSIAASTFWACSSSDSVPTEPLTDGGTDAVGAGGGGTGGQAGTGGTGGAGGAGGVAGAAGTAGVGGGGTAGAAGAAGTGGAPQWEVVAHPKEVAWANGTLAAHPTEPASLAVLLFEEYPSPMLWVATTPDYGESTTKALIWSLPAQPGMYPMVRGFAYDPGNGQNLAGLVLVPSATPEQSCKLSYSMNGGQSFSEKMMYMAVNPFPPDVLKFAAGAEPVMVVRSQEMVYLSEDLGQSWAASYDTSQSCLAHGDVAVSPADHSVLLLVCSGPAAVRCQGETCTPSQVPAQIELTRLEFHPSDASLVLAGGNGPNGGVVLRSTDGGSSFTVVSEAGTGQAKLAFDPRPGQPNAYAYGTGNKLLRSTDGGASWHDVTPPADLEPPYGSYIYDFAVAADGAVVALSAVGTLRLPAP